MFAFFVRRQQSRQLAQAHATLAAAQQERTAACHAVLRAGLSSDSVKLSVRYNVARAKLATAEAALAALLPPVETVPAVRAVPATVPAVRPVRVPPVSYYHAARCQLDSNGCRID